ncbi:MAG TPA: adenylyltransferase/cytidyltransferase family protein, partial [Gemmataceae bacterium]|nr:adenylyltransferase/cytidyltransferase family protein [Gemmataceae bacterium]
MTRPLSNRIAVYTGVFDPVHLGHFDVIRRGARVFDKLIVGVGVNPEKRSFFTLEERVDLVKNLVLPFGNVDVEPFEGLAVRFVREMGAGV